MTVSYVGAAIVPVLDGQLELDLGAGFAAPPVRFDVVLVVCQVCSGHHPVERCPSRSVCTVCSASHHPSVHLLGVLPRKAVT